MDEGATDLNVDAQPEQPAAEDGATDLNIDAQPEQPAEDDGATLLVDAQAEQNDNKEENSSADTDLMSDTTGSGDASVEQSTEDNQVETTEQPGEGEEAEQLAEGEGAEQHAEGEEGDQPGDGEESDQPAEGEEADQSGEGEEAEPSADGEEGDQPAESEEADQPAESEEADQPAEGEEADQPAEGEEGDQPAEGEEGDQPGEGEEAEQPSEGEEAEQPAEGEEADQPADGEEAEQPGDGEEADQPGDGEEVEQSGEGEAQSAAYVDLSGVDEYPLSLRALLAQAKAAVSNEEADKATEDDETMDGGSEAPAEAARGEELPVSEWTIEYDEALFAVTPEDDDYAVMPLASFDSATITVNGFELTLTNCRLPEEAAETTTAEGEEDDQPAEGEEGDQPGEGEAQSAALVDLSGVDQYPLYLRALLAQARAGAETAAESAEEIAEPTVGAESVESVEPAEQEEPAEAARGEELPVSEWTIEYDEALFAVTPEDDDYAVMPLASFDSAAITVNGFELTLTNCRLPEAANDGAEAAPAVNYPAQHFEDSTGSMKVTVDAPAGAFPEGTTMRVQDVEDEQTLSDIENTVSEDFVEVTRVHAVDISFWYEDNEIEPGVPIAVVMSVPEVEAQEEAVVVHVDNDGGTEVVDSQGEAQQGATDVVMEMPGNEQAAEAGEQASDAQASEAGEQPSDGEMPATENVGFEADSFSVYAVVVAKTIETKYIDAKGDTWNISLGYGKEANIPADATLRVSEVTSEAYLEKAVEALDAAKRVTEAYFFDITILDADGNEIQPDAPVQVNITLAEGAKAVSEFKEQYDKQDLGDPDVCVVHFGEENTDVLEATETKEAVSFDAASFSVWGVVYTVDFYYNVDGRTVEYHIHGGMVQSLRALLPILEIVKDAPETEMDEVSRFIEDIEKVEFSDESLVKPVSVSADTTAGEIVDALDVEIEYSAELTEAEIAEIRATQLTAPDWALVSLKPFLTEECLTITLKNGEVVRVKVTDAPDDGNGYIIVNDSNRGYLMRANTEMGSEINSYRVLMGSNGNVMDSNQYAISAVAKDGYVFSKWQLSNGSSTWDAQSENYQTSVLPKNAVTKDQLYNQKLVFTAVFEPIQCRMSVDVNCRGMGQIHVPWDYTTGEEAEYLPGWRDNWNDGNNRNRYVIEAIPGSAYQFVCWEYYEETKHNVWERKTSGDLYQQRFEVGQFDLYREGKGWFYKAVFLPIGFSVGVNKSTETGANLGDVVDEYNNSCLGHVPLTQDGKLTKTIKAVPQSGETFICWKLDGQILPITSDTIHPNDYNFSGALDLQAMFATVIDANGNAQQNIHISDDKQKEFEKWMESLKNKKDVTVDKTAHVVDYDNRIYEVDISASSAKIDFGAEIDLAFILDMSSSMLFPYHLVRMNHEPVLLTQETLNALFPDHNSEHFFISSPTVSSTVYRLFYDLVEEKWYAVDEAWWQTDGGDQQGSTVQLRKFPAEETSRYSDPVGGPYAYPLYTIDISTHRQDYLNACLSDTIQSMKNILTSVRNNGGSTAEINVASLNFCYEVKEFNNFKKLSENPNLGVSITNTEGGTRQDLALAKAKEFNWTEGHQKYAILITDGAPVAARDSGVDLETVYTAVGNNATALKEEDGVTLITVGLSTKNVTRGSRKMFDIASVNPNNPDQNLFFEAEEDGDLKNILYEIVETIIKHAQIGGKITDTVDPAFYPVDENGYPISAGRYDKDGNPLDSDAWQQKMNARESIYEWTVNNGVWTITWYNQHIGWDENNANVDNRPWEKSFHVKAKEDFLGGNRIPTNVSASVTPEAYCPEGGSWMIYDNPTPIPLPEPYVNVDELVLTENSTEWTVYLGTEVAPVEQLKALYNKINVLEVVSESGADHRRTQGSKMITEYGFTPETFPLSALANMNLTDDQWAKLISGEPISPRYGAYGHYRVGKVQISLTKAYAADEPQIAATYDEESKTGTITTDAHPTAVVGDKVEAYTLKVEYIPYTVTERDGYIRTDSNRTDYQGPEWDGEWHTTPGHERGDVTENMLSTNKHVIDVFVKGLRIEKRDKNNQTITTGAAKFKLYRGQYDGETKTGTLAVGSDQIDVVQIGGEITTVNGVATVEQLPLAPNGTYYLVETEAPEGYIRRETPAVIQMNLSNQYWAWNQLQNSATSDLQDGQKPYYWQQSVASMTCDENSLTEESGIYIVGIENQPLGALKLTKVVMLGDVDLSGDDVQAEDKTLADGKYMFSITGPAPSTDVVKYVQITVTNGVAASYMIADTTDDIENNVSTVTSGTGQWALINDLVPGTYTVKETNKNGLELTSATVGTPTNNPAGDSVQVTVTAGDTKAEQIGSNVTFTNATYRTTINIIKVNADSVGQKLNGAQFQLAKWDGTQYQQVGDDYATTEGSDENSGRCSFTGLLNGEYRIKEMVTPAGYIKAENNDIYFKVENGVVTRYNKQVGESDRVPIAENTDEALIKYEKSDKAATFTVGNTPGVALPATGGMGTSLIYALGVGLLALAALGLILRARKENE